MPATHVLVDTNAYLRLARTIRPFIGQYFGSTPFLLSVIPELHQELGGKRLQHKFPWVDEAEHVRERSFFPRLSRANKKGIATNFEFLWEHVVNDLPGPSRVDTLFIAYALELNCLLVTDDQTMRELADVYGVNALCTLELLHLMLANAHIGKQTITTLVSYWQYSNDLPANFQQDYERLFGIV